MTETSPEQLNGRCMCGAVTVTAVAGRPIIRACHCDMCRRWTSSMYMTIPTVPDTIAVTGPVRTFRSSDWAERAFCDTCGSALWYMTLHDQTRQLSAGLFDDAAGHRLALEFFADHVPAGYALAGDHRRMSEAECIALFGDGQNG